ncbi:MAG: ABC transporter permease [Proteobacteria bacterium]|nr:ABC transporter permease [Pseudomonadota bacterium]
MKPLHNVSVIMRYTLHESLNNRILWLACVFAVIGIGGASFVGDFSIVEYKKTEIALLSSFYRFCAVFFMMVLVISTMVREFNDKCLELYLSLPISRFVYFAGKLSGFFVTGVAVAAIYTLMLLFYAEPEATLFWALSLICELMIVTAVSFFCVMTFNQQLPASMATAFFFYLMCRASDGLLLLAKSELILHTTGAAYMTQAMETFVLLLPSLGRFTRSDWLIYGDPAIVELLPLILVQTLIYTLLLSFASLFDFLRKNI